ncbi:MAG: DUF4339 domain-containing protein [Planctomycetes bacterium]|nr:DUF4339 domain-containing protein [Planctomycetota bacterium]
MVAALWYVRKGGKQHGPFTMEVVKQLVQQGKITPLTELKREADIDWVVASSIPGLLVNKQPPPLPSVIPSTLDAPDKTPISIWALAGAAFLILAIIGAYAVFTIVDEAKKQQLALENQIETSNTAVRDCIREASQSLEKGDLDTAERLVRNALAIDGATEKHEAEQMIDTIANAKIHKKAEQLYAKAEKEIQYNNIDIAIRDLREIIESGNVANGLIDKAKELNKEIERSQSVEEAKSVLMQLNDEQYQNFIENNELPRNYRMEKTVLNEAFMKCCQSVSQEVVQSRIIEKEKRIAVEKALRRQQEIGKVLSVCEGNIGEVGFSISSDRRFVASPVKDGSKLSVWDVSEGVESASIVAPANVVVQGKTSFSLDSACIAFAAKFVSESQTAVILWDLQKNAVSGVFGDGTLDEITGIAVTEKHVLATKGKSAHVWDRKSKKIVHSFKKHKDEVNCIAVSSDGLTAATGGEDKIAILWEVESGKELRVLDDHEAGIRAIAFSPTNGQLLTGGFDCSVRYWDLSKGTLIQKWQLGKFDSFKASSWKLRQLSQRLRTIEAIANNRFQDYSFDDEWKLPFVVNVDFSPLGDRAVVGLSLKNPESLLSLLVPYNPIIIDLSGGWVRLPEDRFGATGGDFFPMPFEEKWAAFCREGDSIVVPLEKRIRVRGELQSARNLSVIGIP